MTTNIHQTSESVTDRKGSMTGLVMGGATKDEILDAFDGKFAVRFVHVRDLGLTVCSSA